MARYAADGYRGCIGRTLDRISIFPDGRAYVCSFLFDTDLHFANMVDGQVILNKGPNEFDLFTQVLTKASCGDCKVGSSCMSVSQPRFPRWVGVDSWVWKVQPQVGRGLLAGGGENHQGGDLGSRCGIGTDCAEWVTDQVVQGLDGLDDGGELAGSAPEVVGEDLPLLQLGVGAFAEAA